MKRFVIKGIAASLLLLATSACSSTFRVADLPRDTPILTQYSFDSATRCIRPHIERYLRRSGDRLMLLVNELGDRTRNPRDPYSGPLSWGGDLVFTSLVRSTAPPSLVALPFAMPQEVQLYFAGRGLSWGEVVRLRNGYRVNRILGVSGGFTAFDQNRGSDGGAFGASGRRNDLDLRLEAGRTTEGGRINLVLNIGDVVSNRLLATVRIAGTAGRYSDSFKGTLEVNGIGGGVTSSNVVMDGVHNVQENLIAAAHFYMWAALLPGSAEDDCLYGEDTSPAVVATRMTAYQNASFSEKTALLQQALNRFHGTSHPALPIDGDLGRLTWTSIRAAEVRMGVLPHSRGSLAALYQRLITTRPPR